MITAAPEMLKVARTIERVANADVSVMLLGASGTGKELLARGLHDASRRASGAFVAINCAAIPENLLEAELFGYEKGAFTGAIKTTEGKIELAQGGTLFLDEVGDMPLPLQVKLLRFLQERVIERIGGRKAIAVDTRIVCATHQDLEAMIAGGQLPRGSLLPARRDRRAHPALAERPGDAALLARHFLDTLRRDDEPGGQGLRARCAAPRSTRWRWPGNVRELENRIKRAVIMADGKLRHRRRSRSRRPGRRALPINLQGGARGRRPRARSATRSRATEGNISGAAKLLGISRPTLYDLLKQYDMQD